MADLDPVAFRVLWGRLIGVVEEAGATLRHSAFSSIVSEGNDCTAVLFDAVGREIAEPQSFTATAFIGCMPRAMKIFLTRHPPETWRPGDMLICNDPWMTTGHLFDITLVVPIFHRDRLVGFSATTSHTANIGGAGRLDAKSTFEEGLHIPVCWLQKEGVPNELVYDFIRDNVPVPTQVLGDIKAQVNANFTTRRRVVEIMEELGLEDLQTVSDMIGRTSRAAMTAQIATLPKGLYRYDIKIDSLEREIDICCAVEIVGDGRIRVDFAGTSAQVRSAINCVMHYTIARTFLAIKSVLLPETPGNEASYETIEVMAPEKSILNSRSPFPNAYRSAIGHYIPMVVMGALSRAAPERVIAEGAGPIWSVRASGERAEGEAFAAYILFGTGQGASDRAPGMDCNTYPGNVANTPIEVIERESSLHFIEKSLRRDSGGDGRNRGGWGQRVVVTFTGSAPVSLGVSAGRLTNGAEGLAGGGDARPGAITLDGQPVKIRNQIIAEPGSVLVMETPGGGGYGLPDKRSVTPAA